MAEEFDMIAKTFFGLEGVLADELAALGARDVRMGRRMVAFRGDWPLLVRANVCCRTAVRILKPIHAFTAADEPSLYRGVGQVDWLAHLKPEGSLAIDPVIHSPIFTNSLYAAQLAKDAIVDQLRAATGRRPSVDLADPDLRINLHVAQDRVTVYLDSSGDSLHRRGYRTAAGEAPINEVLAAGILRLSGWDEQSPLADFMCGSGTFLIEAALAARRIAPGLVRKEFGYMRWPEFANHRAAHQAVMAEAAARVLPRAPFPLQGSDLDPRMIGAASENARRAGVEADVSWLIENFDAVRPPAASGTLITNPPYDERMKSAAIEAVYRRLGDALKRHWADHTAFIFTGNRQAARHIGLRASARIRLFNGPIECRLLKFAMSALPTVAEVKQLPRPAHDAAEAFANRLTRMARHWHRWARRQGITCYRIYDRDVPEVPLAIDWYEGRLLITEHARPHGRTDIEQQAWLERMVALASRTLDVERQRIALVARSAAAAQPPRRQSQVIDVHEGGLCFEVHLGSTAQTGLPLDQRILRSMLRSEAAGKCVLNLFARSGASSLAAAAGGASSTTSVEGSRAGADWAERNLRRAGFAVEQHQVIRHDPLQFAREMHSSAPRFDLAIVEPPPFGGKRREGAWNVQDGHAELLNTLLACMRERGKIFFVTTFRRLAFQTSQIEGATIREITRQSVPPDFRNKKVHRAWTLVRTSGSP